MSEETKKRQRKASARDGVRSRQRLLTAIRRGGEVSFGRNWKSQSREEQERSERAALLSVSSNIPGATPVFRPREGHGRRFCRLNAINDLIPVITVLMYRALASERASERGVELSQCHDSYPRGKSKRVVDEVTEGESSSRLHGRQSSSPPT